MTLEASLEFRRIRDVEFAALDSESAGAKPGETDVPVQVGIAILTGGSIPPDRFVRSFIAADRPIRWNARRVHGIRDADLAGAPCLWELWPSIRAALSSRAIVAHGAGTEKRFLRAFSLHPFEPWIDTLELARAFYPGLSSYKLEDLLAALGLVDQVQRCCPGLGWHDALFDAVAALVFLHHLIESANLENQALAVLLHLDRSAYDAHRTHPRQGRVDTPLGGA